MEKNKVKRYPYEKLKRACKEIYLKVGVSEKGSEVLSDCLVRTSARGVKTHGVTRMSMYVKSLTTGDINPTVEPKIIKNNPPTAVIDGQNGMGHINSYKAVQEAVKMANEYGISSVGVRHSTHFGPAAYYTLEAIKNDMIGIIMTNTPTLICPWGGTDKLLGNDPFSIGAPSNQDFEVVLDMALTKVSNTEIRRKAKELKETGGLLPEGWILDKNGNPSRNPEDIIDGDGSLIPIGDYKGANMSFMFNILTGVLMGAAFNGGVGRRHTPKDENVGHHIIVINPSYYMSLEKFKERVDEMVSNVKNSDLADNATKIYAPGEIEGEKEKKSLKEGVPVEDKVISEINDLLDKYGITMKL